MTPDLSRIAAVAADLDRAQHLYTGVYSLVLDVPGTSIGGRTTGKPTTNPPKGTDHPLRAALVASAREIAYGHHLCDQFGAPGDWWQPHRDTQGIWRVFTLGHWHIPDYDWLGLTVDDTGDEDVVVLSVRRERPVWTPPASDLTVTPPTPDALAHAVERLQAGARWAATYDLDLRDIAHHANRALNSLRHVEKVKRIVRGDTGEADWTDPLLVSIVACPACNDQGVCPGHTPDLEVAFACGDLRVVEVWQGADRPRDYPHPRDRCAHYPTCHRLRDGRHRMCRVCRSTVGCPGCVCGHCGEKRREAGRDWCAACRRGHQPDRMSCGVCGLAEEAS